MPTRLRGFLIHCFTASGAGFGIAALFAAADGQFATTFALLGVALVIDAVDGPLARRYDVARTFAHIDGVALDLVVDYLTYVVVPLVALWQSGLLVSPFSIILPCLVGAASALYFADRRMKTEDYWFRGFPAVWNLPVFYLLVLRPDPITSASIIVIAAILMFTPLVFVHPMRVKRLRPLTLVVTGVWSLAAIIAVAQGLSSAAVAVKTVLVVTALYFLLLPVFRGVPSSAT